MTGHRRWRVVFLALTTTLAGIALIEWLVGWSAIARLAGRLTTISWILFALAMLLSYLLRAARLYHYLPALRGRFFDTLRLTVIHNAANNLLPMRSGEIAFPVLARRFFGLPLAQTVAVLGWFRLLDAVVLGLAGLALMLFGARQQAPAGPLLLALLLALAFAPGILAWSLRQLGAGIATHLPGKLAQTLATAASGLPANAAHYLRDYAWTLANWGLKLAVLAGVFLALLPSGTPPLAALGALAGEVSGLLPTVAPAGLGTYEAAVVASVAPLGVGATDALAAAVALHLAILLASMLAALLMSGPLALSVLGIFGRSINDKSSDDAGTPAKPADSNRVP